MRDRIQLIGLPLLLLISHLIKAQEVSVADIIEERIDFLQQEELDANADYTTLFERLEYYFHHPIDLNQKDQSSLRELGLLNEIQIRSLEDHIVKHGKLIAFEELQTIKSFDLETIRRIKPFCFVKENQEIPLPHLSSLMHESRSDLIIRNSRTIEKAEAYKRSAEENGYLGSRDQTYLRYRFQYDRRLSLGITAEKDAGEEFFRGSQSRGFDFYSGHFYIADQGSIKQLAIGDFQAQFGEGLTYWSGLSMSRGLGVGALKRVARGIIPYTSAQESFFLRGSGITLQKGKLSLSSFISRKKLDANVISDSSSFNQFTSIISSGLHRNMTEIAKRKQLGEWQYGGHLQFQGGKSKIGFTAVAWQLDNRIERSADKFRRFDQPAQGQMNLGVNYQSYWNNILLFGETSRSDNGGIASLNAFLWQLHPKMALGVLQRNYSRSYQVIYSGALGSNPRNQNEQGSYLQFEGSLWKGVSINLNLDLHASSWLKYRTDGLSEGSENSIQISYSGGKKWEFYFRYRSREKEQNNTQEAYGVSKLIRERVQKYRWHFKLNLTDDIRYQSRLEISRFEELEKRSMGSMIYQDLRFKKKGARLDLSFRYIIFETDDYDSRIYAYENDVLYAFSIPAVYGKGSRFYLLLHYKLKKGIDLWLKYAQTTYIDRDFISGGLNQIEGSQKSDLKLQLRFSF